MATWIERAGHGGRRSTGSRVRAPACLAPGLLIVSLTCLVIGQGTRAQLFSTDPGEAEREAALLQLGPVLGLAPDSGAQFLIKASRSASSAVVIGGRRDLRDGRSVSGPDLAAERVRICAVTGARTRREAMTMLLPLEA